MLFASVFATTCEDAWSSLNKFAFLVEAAASPVGWDRVKKLNNNIDQFDYSSF